MQFGPEGVARDMIRISTIFIAICMVLVAASLGTADLARQVAEFGRRLAAVEGRVVSANSASSDRIQAVLGEINELGGLVKQLAISVASHEDLLASGAAAPPAPSGRPHSEPQVVPA